MGVAPGVQPSARQPYVDAEVRVSFTALDAHRSFRTGAQPDGVVCVVDGGDVRADGEPASAGDLIEVPPSHDALIAAGAAPVRLFTISAPTARPPTSAVRVLPRPALEPFVAEQILVPKDTPFDYGELNIAEVVVPPHVTTSEHDLGVDERYLMFGPGTVFLGRRAFAAGTGDVVAIPSGTPQSIRNDGESGLRFYCLCTPSFRPDTFGHGELQSSAPPGFDLHEWWEQWRRAP